MVKTFPAQHDSQSCYRCKRPIRAGTMCERIPDAKTGLERIVHSGCEPPDDAPRRLPPALPKAEELPGGLDPEKFMARVKKIVKDYVEFEIDEVAETVTTKVREALVEPLAEMVDRAVAAGIAKAAAELPPKEIVIRRADGGSDHRLPAEIFHERFDDVVEMFDMREDVFLTGPSGSGKSALVRQAARVLGVPFGMVSCSKGMSEGVLNGRLIPRGDRGQFEFLSTLLLHVYEGGGIFLFDEMDAADANVLLVVNSAVANGIMAVPNRYALPDGVTMEQYMAAVEGYNFRTATEPFQYRGYGPYAVRHPDFLAAGAGNTVGTGADRKYVGRDPLDLSTRDRFQLGQIEVGYSPRIERALCPDPVLLATLYTWRKRIEEAGMDDRIVSTRFIEKAYKAHRAGWSIAKIASRYFSSWDADSVRMVYGNPIEA